MVEAAIIMVDNAHKALEHFHDENGRDPDSRERSEAIVRAAQGVGRPLFLLLLVITGELRPSPLARNGGGALRGETEFDFGCVSSARRRPIPRTRLTTSSRRQLSAEAAAAALQRPVV